VLWLGLLTTGLLVLAVAGLLGHLSRPLGWLAARYERVHDRWRPSPRPDTPSVEQIARDLRRLADLLERTASTDEPAKMARLTAAALAYDYVLLTACRTLEVPQPTQLPLDPLARLETEAALARRGLDW
jgi:hypothetical protein